MAIRAGAACVEGRGAAGAGAGERTAGEEWTEGPADTVGEERKLGGGDETLGEERKLGGGDDTLGEERKLGGLLTVGAERLTGGPVPYPCVGHHCGHAFAVSRRG